MMMTIITKVNDDDHNHYAHDQIGQEPMNRIEAGGKVSLVTGAAACIRPDGRDRLIPLTMTSPRQVARRFNRGTET
jgi:hypothetical protein